jgi:hypothetical protein
VRDARTAGSSRRGEPGGGLPLRLTVGPEEKRRRGRLPTPGWLGVRESRDGPGGVRSLRGLRLRERDRRHRSRRFPDLAA